MRFTKDSSANSSAGPSVLGLRFQQKAALRATLIVIAVVIVMTAVSEKGPIWQLGTIVLSLVAGILIEMLPAWRNPDRPSPQAPVLRPVGLADLLLSQIPDPVILVDDDAIVMEANDAAQALLPSLKTAQPLSFALRSPNVLDAIDSVFRTGTAMKVEYAERVPTERIFEVRVAPLMGQADLPGIVLFFRDMTSARLLEHMRVDFVANASHELRTPLASLLGFIETLQGSARDDAVARERFLEVMRVQAQRMSRLIDDLLSLSRIEMQVHLPPVASVDFSAIVRHMIETLTPLAQEGNILIEARIEQSFHVLGDRDDLLRVAENLIENAVKYGESGGYVEVSLERKPPGNRHPACVVLSVRDHGPGIAPEHLPRLTERFYRADVAQSRQKGGTGLGLAIVKHIVNRHRGQLTIESEVGHGALFRVTLPEAEPKSGSYFQ